MILTKAALRPAKCPSHTLPANLRLPQLRRLSPLNMFRLGTFFARYDFEDDFFTLTQSLEAFAQNCRVMNEHILATILRDEPKSLFIIPPLHFASCHMRLS